jgi:GT2 family glycosyltransferase
MNLVARKASLHIVIPVLNGWAQTKRCLETLRESTYQDFRVIVVDHGSTDETKEALPTEFPEVECIQGNDSLWWAGATNLGIRQALASVASHIMLLNNDCYFSPDAIEKLLQYSQECDDNCIVAPISKDQLSGKVLNLGYTTCLWLGFPSIRIPVGLSQRNLENRGLIPTHLIMGGRGAIIPATVFEKVGLLDEENLPHYLADHDFYLRCKDAGIRLMIATDAHLFVDNARTTIADNLSSMPFSTFRETLSGRRSHRNFKDLSAFFKKHYPIKKWYLIGVAMNFARYFLRYVGARILNLCASPGKQWH